MQVNSIPIPGLENTTMRGRLLHQDMMMVLKLIIL